MTHQCDMTHSDVWHDAFIRLSWHIHMCHMTYSHVSHDAFMCVTWAADVWHGTWQMQTHLHPTLFCVCAQTHFHTSPHKTYKQTQLTYIQTYIHVHTHTYIFTYVHTYIYTYRHIYKDTDRQTDKDLSPSSPKVAFSSFKRPRPSSFKSAVLCRHATACSLWLAAWTLSLH